MTDYTMFFVDRSEYYFGVKITEEQQKY